MGLAPLLLRQPLQSAQHLFGGQINSVDTFTRLGGPADGKTVRSRLNNLPKWITLVDLRVSGFRSDTKKQKQGGG